MKRAISLILLFLLGTSTTCFSTPETTNENKYRIVRRGIIAPIVIPDRVTSPNNEDMGFILSENDVLKNGMIQNRKEMRDNLSIHTTVEVVNNEYVYTIIAL